MTITDAFFDPAVFQAELQDSGYKLKTFRDAIQNSSQQLAREFNEGQTASILVHKRANTIDLVLSQAWQHIMGADNKDLALIAVGGYGRRELHPGSDIDILILVGTRNVKKFHDQLETFITLLWDIGIEVGQSVRTIRECVREAKADITVITNLVESRLVCGPPALYQKLSDSVGPDKIWPSKKFFEAKRQEQVERHHRFNDAFYNLEPNVKEGPGGLRDLQMIGWVAKRHFNANTLHELVHHHFLTETEYWTLMESQEFLWKVRMGLHIETGRREDRLLFDHQKVLAEKLGYSATERTMAVERFMRDYYRAIMELNRLNDMLLQLFKEAILYTRDAQKVTRLNRRFQVRQGFIEVTEKNIFQRYPFALLEIFLLLQQNTELHGIRASTIRLMRDHRHLINDAFRKDLRNRSLFMEILRQPTGVTTQLRRMNRYGILAEYIPAFGRIVAIMQYDLFHVYTVDQHTLMVLRNMRRFSVAEFSHEFPLCSKIHQHLPKPEILYLAGLFHDIAKGRGGDHSNLGAQDALEFCLHHGMSQYDARFVSWLVRHHLVMSRTAQHQDVSDPDVITAFSQLVGDQRHLDYLYLLTVADVCATSPKLWNSWRDALLKQLYTATKRALRRGLENPIDRNERLVETKEDALERLKSREIDEQAAHAFWAGIDDEYFFRYTGAEIAWHTRAILDNQSDELPLILVRNESRRGGTEIFVYTPDQKDLFATITHALDQMRLNIVDARIITTRGDYILDTFIVLDESGQPIVDSHRARQIMDNLKRDIRAPHKQHPEQPTIQRRLKHFRIPVEISFSTDLIAQRTVMELVSADRPGLLSKVADAMAECNVSIENARIATIGERVEDIFVLTDDNDAPLTDEALINRLHHSVIEHLQELNE
jgi:[protein-PII] uridylyltransferase